MARTVASSVTRFEVFPADTYAASAASWITEALAGRSSVVVTGGRTAKLIYPELAAATLDWSGIDVFFSDERCVPPRDDESNYRMACELLLDHVRPRSIKRMRGEDDPEAAAALYEEQVSELYEGPDLVLLGLGGDCHIAGIFPGGPVVGERERSCAAVERPDGHKGLTLTPVPLLAANQVVVITHGQGKAEAVARALDEGERAEDCPARLLATHANVTFLLDEPAARAVK